MKFITTDEDTQYPPIQYKSILEVTKLLDDNNFVYDDDNVHLKYSVENEYLLIKNNDNGIHYLIIDEEGDVSYGFVGKEIGKYSYKDIDDNNSIIDIIGYFING